ncbi:MAG TPA: MFS transporter [Chloroflexota bacterium]|nr:MFS transporter [Chloroflexota bacterium]
MTAALRRSIGPLEAPNFRRFFAGQLASLTGTWVQTVAELWLVLSITGSAVSLGLTTAFQFAPMLLVAAGAGVLADRFPKRRILLITQSAMVLPALALFTLTVSGAIELWMIWALVFARGLANAVDHPVRQAFVIEMVGPERLASAVSLNAALVSAARMAGPAVGGVLIATAGVAACFALNALSFVPVLWALARIDAGGLHITPIPAGAPRATLRGGLRYVRGNPDLLVPLAVTALVGTLAFNYPVVLPLLARFTFESGAAGYGALAAAMGAGAVLGALANAGRRHAPRHSDVVALSAAFGAAGLLAAAAPTFPLAIAALVLLGAASTAFSATVNAILQLQAEPAMRGRVVALFSMVFLGSTPIGGPAVGYVCEHLGARAGLLVGAFAALGAAVFVRRLLARGVIGKGKAARPCERTARPRRPRATAPAGPRRGEPAGRGLASAPAER